MAIKARSEENDYMDDHTATGTHCHNWFMMRLLFLSSDGN